MVKDKKRVGNVYYLCCLGSYGELDYIYDLEDCNFKTVKSLDIWFLHDIPLNTGSCSYSDEISEGVLVYNKLSELIHDFLTDIDMDELNSYNDKNKYAIDRVALLENSKFFVLRMDVSTKKFSFVDPRSIKKIGENVISNLYKLM